ncbi:MAG: hypothetical protein ACD_58C00211G0001 [uncultured bacterium]|nr:MAG: hypothetical protein ACD_58C00211G0001 [uncultured bacterium]
MMFGDRPIRLGRHIYINQMIKEAIFVVKIIFVIVVFCIVVLYAIGCSVGGGSTNNYYSTSGGALPSPTPDPDKTEITIKVLNNSNNAPINQANVTFTPTNIKTESDSSGNAVAKNMTVQLYKITTQHALYNTDEQNITPTTPTFSYTVKLIPK